MAQTPAQAQRSKNLDALQGMLNGILIETGRALRISNSGGTKSLAATVTRLPATVPSVNETFQQTLDDIECNILRAKSVLLRDLEGLRARRRALENPPPPVIEEVRTNGTTAEEEKSQEIPVEREKLQAETQPEFNPSIKQERSKSPEKAPNAQQPVPDPPKETIIKPEPTKPLQAPSPPPSSNETSKEPKPIGLGINTDAADPSTSAPATADAHDSAIDSLFDIPDDTNGELNFDNMDFTYNSNTNQDTSQTQNNEFDLSTFGNESQDFTMPNIPTTQDTNTANNTTNTSENKPVEDIFSGLDTSGTGDNMELDNLDFATLGAEESVFDDMLFGAGDGGGEMVHGDFDNAFFGLED